HSARKNRRCSGSSIPRHPHRSWRAHPKSLCSLSGTLPPPPGTPKYETSWTAPSQKPGFSPSSLISSRFGPSWCALRLTLRRCICPALTPDGDLPILPSRRKDEQRGYFAQPLRSIVVANRLPHGCFRHQIESITQSAWPFTANRAPATPAAPPSHLQSPCPLT